MPKLLLPIAAVLAVGAVTAGGATYVLTRDDTVQEVPPPAVQATGTPSPAATETPATPTPTPTAKPEPTATPTPDPAADWRTYTDPELGFKLNYPQDLVFKDLTGPTPSGGLQERVIEFRSEADPSQAIAVSVVYSGLAGRTLEEWAVEFAACQPKSVKPSMLGGVSAIACTREVIESRAAQAIVAENSGRILLISATSEWTETEFHRVVEGFQF